MFLCFIFDSHPKKFKAIIWLYTPFSATGLFLYTLETLENTRFSDVLEGNRKKPIAWNELIGEYSERIWQIILE